MFGIVGLILLRIRVVFYSCKVRTPVLHAWLFDDNSI